MSRRNIVSVKLMVGMGDLKEGVKNGWRKTRETREQKGERSFAEKENRCIAFIHIYVHIYVHMNTYVHVVCIVCIDKKNTLAQKSSRIHNTS